MNDLWFIWVWAGCVAAFITIAIIEKVKKKQKKPLTKPTIVIGEVTNLHIKKKTVEK